MSRSAGKPSRSSVTRIGLEQDKGVGAPPPLSDESLLEQSASDPELFGLFYRRHEDRILAYFLRRGATPELAADLTAEVFAAALEAADRFGSGPRPAEAGLCGIARRKLALSRRRSRVEARAAQARNATA
jgi:DNA-directed RNA polymerase specialized sigma24 family protein